MLTVGDHCSILTTMAGFLTTFSLLARGSFTFRQMSWILIKVFFGSSYLGFVSDTLHPDDWQDWLTHHRM